LRAASRPAPPASGGHGRPRRGAARALPTARVGIVGGGPAGSFFATFLLALAETLGRRLTVEIHEARDFSSPAPRGCNTCGGIVSESLVQMLASEGIVLPPTMVQRGIEACVLHMDVGTMRIETPRMDWALATGPVHIGSLGGAHPVGLSMVGEAVVRAYRLEKLADEATGGIVADAATRERAGAGFAFRHLGPRRLEGFDRDEEVFALVRPRDDAASPGAARTTLRTGRRLAAAPALGYPMQGIPPRRDILATRDAPFAGLK